MMRFATNRMLYSHPWPNCAANDSRVIPLIRLHVVNSKFSKGPPPIVLNGLPSFTLDSGLLTLYHTPLLAIILVITAMILDGIFGEPPWLWSRCPHPVVLFGRLLTWLENKTNPAFDAANRPLDPRKRRKALWRGGGVLLLYLSLLVLPAGLLQVILLQIPGGWLLVAALCAILIAQKSLVQHVRAVAQAMSTATSPEDALQAGRQAVSLIVGRDPESLDAAGVCRAAIESSAENFSDGVIAPLFWVLLGGLPGLVFYKAINTADSMIGHRTERYEAFGKSAARLDDLVNALPARLTGLLLLLTSLSPTSHKSHERPAGFLPALKALIQDAPHHKSPNAGWPEAAMAGILGLALAGPRRYGQDIVEDPWMNRQGSPLATPEDIVKALRCLWQSWALVLAGLCCGAVLSIWLSNV